MEEILLAALDERRRLLKKRPGLAGFQKEIDHCLGKAGGTENRMAVLGFMVEASFELLRQTVSNLDARDEKNTPRPPSVSPSTGEKTTNGRNRPPR